jgi:hypothetical protein
MKAVALAALLIGASFAVSPASAMPANQGIAKYVPQSQVVEVGMNKWKGSNHNYWRRRHHHDNDNDFGFGFGLGFPLALGLGLATPYYRDRPRCDGYWHRHYSGRLHCHGTLY